jgi:6-methylsalicylate decarboxylase
MTLHEDTREQARLEETMPSPRGLSRRQFGLVGASFALMGLAPRWSRAGTVERIIDVHHHFLPPQYLREAPASANLQRAIDWTPARNLEAMDRNGVQIAMLSFPTPLWWYEGVEPGRKLARLCNDYCAGLRQQQPYRYGIFAGVPPLGDSEGCLREIDYAYGTLKADGVTVMTSYYGRYLGDEAFRPVWDELNRRAAVVFVHPTDPTCCLKMDDGVIPAYGEWPFDTARTFMSLWTSTALLKWPRIRFIFSHGGGALPMIADRIDRIGRIPAEGGQRIHDAWPLIRKVYFDLANAANPPALAAVRAMASPQRILFGSDYPYVPLQLGTDYLRRANLTASERGAIYTANALGLLPHLESLLG